MIDNQPPKIEPTRRHRRQPIKIHLLRQPSSTGPVKGHDLPAWTAGKLIAGVSQAVKYAAANGDTSACGQAGDLLTELGLALLTSHGAQTITVASGCLIEAADLLDRVADRITVDEWSQCPCGTDHGQKPLDAKVAPAMRDDAAFARMVANRSPDDPEPTKNITKHTSGREGDLRLVQ